MKNETIAALAAALAIILGIQAYMTYRLNDRLNQLTGSHSLSTDSKINTSTPPKTKHSQPPINDDALKEDSWDPYAEIRHMQNQVEGMFENTFSRLHMKTPLGSLSKTPDVDLQEKPDRYIVTVNAPGADEASMNVKLEDRTLRIAIKTEHTKDEADDKNGKYQYRERFVGQFQRLLTLPGPTNAAKMTSEYRKGVLTITLPKA